MLDEKQITDQVERSFIRGAIYSLPRRWKWVGMVLIVVGTVAAHHFGLV
ncbi:MAG: hypothetical protein ACREPQ_00715 [Rhodanobacter sp.]|jgi:hypothetical protein